MEWLEQCCESLVREEVLDPQSVEARSVVLVQQPDGGGGLLSSLDEPFFVNFAQNVIV